MLLSSSNPTIHATMRRRFVTPRILPAAFALACLGFAAGVQADTISDAAVTLSDVAVGATGTTVTFSFTMVSSIAAGGSGVGARQIRFWMPSTDDWFPNSLGFNVNGTCPSAVTIEVDDVARTPAELGITICGSPVGHSLLLSFAGGTGSGIPSGAKVEVKVSDAVTMFDTSSGNPNRFANSNAMFLFGVDDADGNPVDVADPMPAVITNRRPVASGVSIAGNVEAGSTLTGSYTYSDAESNPESGTTFRWVRNAVSSGVAGSTAVGSAATYDTDVDDVGNYLFFCVTPGSSSGALSGVEVCSAAAGPVTAPPQDGSCGTAAGQSFAAVPATGLCATGSAGPVSVGAGAFSWTCAGQAGGADSALCVANWAASGGGGSAAVSAPVQGAGWALVSASVGAIPPAPVPAGFVLPNGVASFVLDSGTAGSNATVVIQYTQPVPEGAVYMKYGPSPEGFQCSGAACAQDHWYALPPERAVFAPDRLSVTLTLQDGGVGDADLAANASITDPGGPAVPAAGEARPIPAVSLGGLTLLGGLVGVATLLQRRRLRRL